MTFLPDHILRRMSPKDRAALGKAGVTVGEAQAKFIARNEREIHSQILSLFRLRGIWTLYDNPTKKRTGTKGAPDFLISLDGRAIAIEVKMPGQVPRPDQMDCHTLMRANGWTVVVVTSVQEVAEILKNNLTLR